MLFKINFLIACLYAILPLGLCGAETNGSNTGYLEYKEPAISTATSATSTFFYIVSLLVVFAFVLGSAYFVSKFIGNRFGSFGKASSSNNFVGAIPVDQNKRLVFFQMNGSLFVLGVTEQNITLVKEFDNIEDIESVKKELFDDEKANNLFGSHTKTLGSLQNKLKPMLRNLPDGKKGEKDK